MDRQDLDNMWDDGERTGDAPPGGIDFGVDMVSKIDESSLAGSTISPIAGGGREDSLTADTAEIDNLLIEFVERMNARDLDGLAELLAVDATAGSLRGTSRDGVLDGLDDFWAANPTLIVTRGDVGVDPVAGVWLFDPDQGRYCHSGYFSIELAEGDEPRVGRLDFTEEPPGWPELVAESPDVAERPEWQAWDVNP